MKSIEKLSSSSPSNTCANTTKNQLYHRIVKICTFLDPQRDWVCPGSFLQIPLNNSSIKLIIQVIDLIKLSPCLIIKQSVSSTLIHFDKSSKKLLFIRPLRKFNANTIRIDRSFIERFECLITYLDNRDNAAYISDLAKAIRIDVQSLRNYFSIFHLVNSKPDLVVRYVNQIIHPSTFEFKKGMRVQIKLEEDES